MNVTPDGRRYLALAQHQRIARPFHYRILIPWLCGTEARRWYWTAQLSTVGIALLAVWWTDLHGYEWQYQLAAPFFVIGLAGVWRFNRTYPILVDAPAMFFALLAACFLEAGWWPLAIGAAVVAGATKETAPIFAAAWSGPLLLVGLIPVAVRLFMKAGADVLDDRNAWILQHPIRASRQFHAGQWDNLLLMVAPWGVLLTGLWDPDPRLLLVLALAYGQLFVATDTVRLYQWAWPTLLIASMGVAPAELLAVAVIAHWCNPWKGPGC